MVVVSAARIVKLRIQAVDFHRDIVHINGEKGDGHREIPLNDTSRRIFQELVTKARSKGYEFIFTNPVTGRPFAWLYRGWRQACKLAGIEDLRIHGLRHTFGTRAADEGVRLPAIQAVMGHKSVKTTMQILTRRRKECGGRAAERKPEKSVEFWSKASGGVE